MSLFAIDSTSDVAPYEQVRVQIAQQVSSGLLEAGAKLPTVRHLAADLGLAVNTVARAFRELEADGVIVTRGRKGSFVSSRTIDAPGDDAAILAAAAQYAAASRARGLTLAESTRLLERAWPKS
jgi:DNA-binding transcriptional regulator YhcF (GntR family)